MEPLAVPAQVLPLRRLALEDLDQLDLDGPGAVHREPQLAVGAPAADGAVGERRLPHVEGAEDRLVVGKRAVEVLDHVGDLVDGSQPETGGVVRLQRGLLRGSPIHGIGRAPGSTPRCRSRPGAPLRSGQVTSGIP